MRPPIPTFAARALCLAALCLSACPLPPELPDPTPTAVEPVWGYADLHAHPASHLAFGARDDGTRGLLHGYPGLGLEDGKRNLVRHLDRCDVGNHVPVFGDLLRNEARATVLKQAGAISGFPHAPGGGGQYEGWPHAQSILHQQMHVTALRRAYEGGLRLMVASVTDNQLIGEAFWNNNHGATPEHEFASAVRQVKFIQEQAAANASWMQVVKTPEEARTAISEGKLAIVLAVEMDSLDIGRLRRLIEEYDVRVVTPVHLADSPSFGGSAIYADLFNANSAYLTGSYFSAVGDEDLRFRLGRPEWPNNFGFDLPPFGPVQITLPYPIPHGGFCDLGYMSCPEQPVAGALPWHQGMKNSKGLHRLGIRQLLRRGVILDVSHMSERALAEVVDFTGKLEYPIMASHGGIRPDGAPATSERSLLASHAQAIAAKGGMLGLGTEGDLRPQQLLLGEHRHRFDDNHPSFELNLEQAELARLEVTVTAAGNVVAPAGAVFVGAQLRGAPLLEVPLNPHAPWLNGEARTATFTLAAPAEEVALLSIRLRLTGAGNVPITAIRLEGISPRGQRKTLLDVGADPAAPMHLLSDAAPLATQRLRLAPEAHVARFLAEIHTGDDGLDAADRATGTVFTATSAGRLPRGFDQDLSGGVPWAAGHPELRTFALPAGTRFDQLEHFRLRFRTDDAALPIISLSGESWTEGGRWDVSRLRLFVESTEGDRVELIDAQTPRDTWTAKWAAGDLSVPLFRAPPVPGHTPIAALRLRLKVTSEDMTDTDRDIPLKISTRVGDVTTSLNLGGKLEEGVVVRIVPLPRGTTVADLERLSIERNGVDTWEFSWITVDVLADPVVTWAEEYRHTHEIMGKRGLALGTDINGMAPQIPFTHVEVPERLDVAHRRAPESLRETAPVLGTDRLGDTLFPFGERGLAHYGLLPDFLQAVEGTGNHDLVDAIFGTAEAFIRMWEGAQAAKANAEAWDDLTARRLRFAVKTANDDLRCDSAAKAFVRLQDGRELAVDLPSPQRDGEVQTVELDLGAPVSINLLDAVGLRTDLGSGNASCLGGIDHLDDEWKVQSLTVDVQNDAGVWEQLHHRDDRPLKHFIIRSHASQEWTDLIGE